MDLPDWLLKGPFPREKATAERCRITELLNDPACPEVSLALARVGPGVTTRLHSLTGIAERYVIVRGEGVVEVGGRRAPVQVGDRVLIAPGVPQRIRNTGSGDLVTLFWASEIFDPALPDTHPAGART